MNIKEVDSTYIENVNAEVKTTDMIEKYLDEKISESIKEKLEGIERDEKLLIKIPNKIEIFRRKVHSKIINFIDWILNIIFYITGKFTTERKNG